MISREELYGRARAAAAVAYAPYSGFRVGAALECDDGSVVVGCNVENRSYGLTCCAERSALFSALSVGKRRFTALAIYSPDSPAPLPPCGACRQVLSEFVDPGFPVICLGADGAAIELTVAELLPRDSLHDLRPRPADRGGP
jgi:cytidine deaminase